MESEYIADTNAVQEAIFICKLYASIGKPIEGPTIHLTDSEAALNHTRNNINHARTKHIDMRYHYIQELHALNIMISCHYGLVEMKFYTVLFGVSRALRVLPRLVWDQYAPLPAA
jgi:hypothetical protein